MSEQICAQDHDQRLQDAFGTLLEQFSEILTERPRLAEAIHTKALCVRNCRVPNVDSNLVAMLRHHVDHERGNRVDAINNNRHCGPKTR